MYSGQSLRSSSTVLEELEEELAGSKLMFIGWSTLVPRVWVEKQSRNMCRPSPSATVWCRYTHSINPPLDERRPHLADRYQAERGKRAVERKVGMDERGRRKVPALQLRIGVGEPVAVVDHLEAYLVVEVFLELDPSVVRVCLHVACEVAALSAETHERGLEVGCRRGLVAVEGEA